MTLDDRVGRISMSRGGRVGVRGKGACGDWHGLGPSHAAYAAGSVMRLLSESTAGAAMMCGWIIVIVTDVN